jgi:LAGLIDADG endonuclease
MEFISQHFQGAWSYNKVTDSWVFTVKRQSEVAKLLAIFSTHPLYGVKRLDYLDLCLAHELFDKRL